MSLQDYGLQFPRALNSKYDGWFSVEGRPVDKGLPLSTLVSQNLNVFLIRLCSFANVRVISGGYGRRFRTFPPLLILTFVT